MAGGLDMHSPRRGQLEQGCEKGPLLMPRSPLIVAPSGTTSPSSSTSICVKHVSLEGLLTQQGWNQSESEKISMLRCTSTTSSTTIIKGYGTMELSPDKNANSIFGSTEDRPEVDGDLVHRKHSSNQSETESDSDTCSNSESNVLIIHPDSSYPQQRQRLPSILRIPSGIRTLEKKSSSVVFSIDILSDSEDEHEEDDGAAERVKERRRRHKEKQKTNVCGARCIPRRLTMDEKAALYRIRPDLEHSSTILQIRELEERRRQKQRTIVFSGLAGSLLLFMIIVFYYIVTQM